MMSYHSQIVSSMSSSSPPTLVLERGPLRVEVDPSHGAELRSVRHSRVGELLWRAPAAAPARHGDLDEATWTAQYGGGWQVLFPNAGDASPTHGFHGAASTAPWSVVAHDTDSAVLAWTGHGLAIERHLALGDSGRLELRDAVHNLGGTPLPYLLGHHPTFGGALLGGVAAGVFDGPAEAAEACVRVTRVVEPRPEWVARYAELRPAFQAAWPALQAVRAAVG